MTLEELDIVIPAPTEEEERLAREKRMKPLQRVPVMVTRADVRKRLNKECPCGSGRKAKNCCYKQH